MIALFNLFLLLAEYGPVEEFFRGEKYQPMWKVINFLIFVAVMVYLLRNKIGIGKIFDDRAASIRKELEKAKIEKDEAERKLAEVETRLSRLDDEIARMKADAEREAEREAERIRQTAAADAEKIAQMTAREIQGAVKEARTELRAFVAENAVGLAEAIIKREINAQDSSRMLNKYVEELREVAK